MSVFRPLPLDSIQVSCDTSVLNMDIQLSPVTRSSSTVQCLLSTSHLSLLITILMFESVNLLVTAVVISDKNQRVKSPTLTFIQLTAGQTYIGTFPKLGTRKDTLYVFISDVGTIIK